MKDEPIVRPATDAEQREALAKFMCEHEEEVVRRQQRVDHLLHIWEGATGEEILEDIFFAMQLVMFRLRQERRQT